MKDIKIYCEDVTKKSEIETWLVKHELTTNYTDQLEKSVLKICSRGISIQPDWSLNSIPLLFSPYIPFNENNFNVAIQIILGNYASIDNRILPENSLLASNLDIINTIIGGGIGYQNIYDDYISQQQFEDYAIEHNKAVILFYNSHQLQVDKEEILEQFNHATYLAPDAEFLAFTNYINLIYLVEQEEFEEAIEVANKSVRRQICVEHKIITLLLIFARLTQGEDSLEHEKNIIFLQENLHELLQENEIQDELKYQYYFSMFIRYETQMNFDDAEKYIEEGLSKIQDEHFVAMLQLHLGDLNIKKAQHGEVVCFQTAQKAYQKALQKFSKENDPQLYAHCQMNLGIIYAELPGIDHKKHVYGGLAQTAFTEALHVFNKFEEPEMYAAVCVNYANAMMRLLPEVDNERFDKISFYIFESLNIRTAEEFPEERAMSILTLLNLYFHRLETAEEIDTVWFDEIENMSNEIVKLTHNEFIIDAANNALISAEEIKQSI